MDRRAWGVLFTMAVLLLLPVAQKADWPARPVFAEDMSFTVEVAPAPSPEPTPESEDTFLQVEVIRETEPPSPWAGKRVLIYHTHTYEAYTQDPNDRYKETEKWRTEDAEHNVISVGRILTAQLRALGVEVVHDETAFEPPNMDDAYARSLAMLEDRAAMGETYDLYIDLHRDGIADTSTIRRTVNIGGEEVARFMVLIGKGTTGGYEDKPDWEANLQIAARITSSLNGQQDGLCRDVKVKTGRYNQHIAPRCVLIECGMNCNTLAQVVAGLPYLAQAIADALSIP